MTFIIRGAPHFENYRGTDRKHPYYREEFDKLHPVNRMFFRYLEVSNTVSIITDIDQAKEIADTYNTYLPSENFEVIQITNDAKAIFQGDFLGFDLSSGLNISYLSSGLYLCNESSIFQSDTGTFLCLIERFFKPKLNTCILFQSYDVAIFLRSCISAMNNAYPNCWDDPSRYQVIGLWKVK
jgi:hypothetical protein